MEYDWALEGAIPMKGNVFSIKNSTYGFIFMEDGETCFFHKNDLKNCSIRQIEEGDYLEFDVVPGKDGGLKAKNIRKVGQMSRERDLITPGINPKCYLDHYNSDELEIIKKLGTVLYVSSGGSEIQLLNSTYKYCLIKPTEYFVHTFKLNREIVVVFSDYVSFEPRELDAAPYVYQITTSKLRLDRSCHVIISHDANAESKLVEIIKDNNLNQVIIPFTYSELLNSKNVESLIQDRFRKYLFDVDLFAQVAPIQDDVFFFGRRDFAHDIATKCKTNVHSGVFGLRRSGKTSLLYAVQRLLKEQSYPTVFIPCESDLCNLDWRTALCKVVRNVYQEFDRDASSISEADYRTEDTTIFFEEDLYECLKSAGVPVTLMFDEIEAITFDVAHGEGESNLWCDGYNFINFWNAIKGYYSKYPNQISVLVAGTNPMINEVATIGKNNLANPMYGQLSQSNQGSYLRAFSEDDTRRMVNTLGGYMGLSFDDYTVSRLVSDCGGHPYLMRMLCSFINRYMRDASLKRPATVSKSIYDKAAPEFEKSSEAMKFYSMILNILMTNYPKEFESLKILALEGDDYIARTQDSGNLHHLLGYGLIEHNQGNYAIRYSTITRFLRGEYKFERKGLSVEDQKEEIQLRINNAEMQLRKLVRNTLSQQFGRDGAKEIVLKSMKAHPSINNNNIKKAESIDYKGLFDTSQNPMYFSLLTDIILDQYDVFKNIFENEDENNIRLHLKRINFARRCPDHSFSEDAANWSWEKFEEFRESILWLENILSNYE